MDDAAFKVKTAELKEQAAATNEALVQLGDATSARGETALVLFDWSQRAADLWRGSNNAVRRKILDAVCLNRMLGDVNLVTEKRKPFDVLAERHEIKNSRGDWTPFELFLAGIQGLDTTIRAMLCQPRTLRDAL